MYRLTCEAMGEEGCQFEATGDTKEETFSKMRTHHATQHEVGKKEDEERMLQRMDDAIEEE